MKTQETIDNLLDVGIEYQKIGDVLISHFGYKRKYYPNFQENLEFEYIGDDFEKHVIMFNLSADDMQPILGLPKYGTDNDSIQLYIAEAFDCINDYLNPLTPMV